MIKILKKNGEIQNFNGEKIRKAIRKSAERVCVQLTDKDEKKVVDTVRKNLQYNETAVSVSTIHNMVEVALDSVNPAIAKSYREYRDNKSHFASMLDKVYNKKLSLSFCGDRQNANQDSALVTTQKAIVYNELNSELYKKFFLTQKEERAVSDGYIYIHDRGSRLDTINCCLFDMKNLITGGFVMGNLDYKEPNSLSAAMAMMSSVIMSGSSSQYGGFTVSQIDKLLAPYAEKSYNKYIEEYKNICTGAGITEIDDSKADAYAISKITRDFEQGFQAWEMDFNSVASSRGDYPFTSITFGLGTSRFETLCSSVCMKVRKNGQGDKVKHPVLFPKINFFYDENLHGPGKELEWLFDEAIECSSKAMYPDYISCTGDGYDGNMYKKYGTPISKMGCVKGNSTISIKYGKLELNDIRIDDMWKILEKDKTVLNQSKLGYSKDGEYIDLNDVYILDKSGYTKCSRIIRNYNESKWLGITLESGERIVCTYDHPWTLESADDIHAINLKINDKAITSDGNVSRIVKIENIEETMDSFDVTTETSHFVVNGIYTHNCRANLSPWFIRGGMEPADENDKPVYEGRFNMGAISLHFPMIVAKAKKEDKDFYEVLDYYLEMSRGIHKRTFEYLSHKKAGINPLGFCQGGFLNGKKDPEEELGEDFLRPMTISFGITALNEASILATGKSISQDNSWAIDVLKHINEYVNRIKKEDKILYAIYGTPAESLCHTQIEQFRAKYGIIKDVSDHEYTSNSFHCCVRDDLTPIQKQDIEYPMYHLCTGGRIQYVRYHLPYNLEAIKSLVRRAMKMGFYEGVNFSSSWCEECSYAFTDADHCPRCGSEHITTIERMNGYLGYSRVRGRSMYADHKLTEFNERKSM